MTIHVAIRYGLGIIVIISFGDGGSEQTAVSRGFIVEPAEMDSRSY